LHNDTHCSDEHIIMQVTMQTMNDDLDLR
jgi:hypothetical protein